MRQTGHSTAAHTQHASSEHPYSGLLASQSSAALEKEKALVKYAREYILMGDECLKHDMKEAAMKNYEKAVTLCPKFKEAWKKIKKLEKEMLKR